MIKEKCDYKKIGKIYNTDLRRHGICQIRTHRGCRGSGHMKKIDVQTSVWKNMHHNSQSGVNQSNLTQVYIEKREKKEKTNITQKVNIGYFNARSVGNKAENLARYITEKKLDICAITETWLTDGDADQVIRGNLTPQGYKLQMANRPSKGSTTSGGGVAVLHKCSLNVHKKIQVSFGIYM